MKKIYILLYVMILLGLCSSVLAIDTTNLIAYYSFDINNNNVNDSSGNNNNGTITGADWVDGGGILGSAFDWERDDAGDRLMTPINWKTELDDVGDNDDYTIAMWVKFESENTDSALIYSDGSNTADPHDYRANTQFMVKTGGGALITWAYDVVTTNWYYLTFVRNSSSYCLYVNATLQSCSSSGTPTSADILFGARGNGYDEEHDGLIDEISLWTDALTTAEIVELYNSGAGYNPFGSGASGSTTSVNLISPTNASTINYLDEIAFSFNVSFTADNCSLYTNETGNWSIEETTTFIGDFISQEDYNATGTSPPPLSSHTYYNYSNIGILDYMVIRNSTDNKTYNISVNSQCDSNPLQVIVSSNLIFKDNIGCWNDSSWNYLTGYTDYLSYNGSWWNVGDGGESSFRHNLSLEDNYIWNVECQNSTNTSTASNNYTLTVDSINATISFNSSIQELQEQTMSVRINSTQGISVSYGALEYNGTYQTVTKTTTDNYDEYSATFTTPAISGSVDFTWYYNVTTNNGQTIIKQSSGTQSVGTIGIDNCSVHNITAINFTFKEDNTKELMNGTLVSYMRLWITSENSYKEFNLTWAENTSVRLCIDNATSNYSVFSQLEYDTTKADYGKKTYYLYNTTLDNITDYVTLYFSANTTQVTFSVTDENDNNIDDVYIHIADYDIGTHSYVTTEIVRTDESGNAIGNIILYNRWYKFFLYYQGELKQETEPIKIISTTKNFRVDLLGDDFFDDYNEVEDIYSSLTFNNATGNFALTWSNPTGLAKTACLTVKKRGVLNDEFVNETCLTSASGTILVNVGNETAGFLYQATATIEGSPEFLRHLLDIDYTEDAYLTLGQEGLFLITILRMAMAMIGIWNPIIAICLIIFTDILLVAGGMLKMAWSTIMVYLALAGVTMWRMRK